MANFDIDSSLFSCRKKENNNLNIHSFFFSEKDTKITVV